MPPRVLILRAPGTNCDHETAYAFERAGGKAERVHVNRLLEDPALVRDYQIFCVPGGFCYGDDLAAGRILASQLRHYLAQSLLEFREAGKLILGICNGFQALLQTEILLPTDGEGPLATLTLNASGHFEDRWVRLGVVGNPSVFLAGIEQMDVPVAHAEGQFVARSEQVLSHLKTSGLVVLRYLSQQNPVSDAEVPYPENPNGSMGNVAGLCDATGRVLGLMPHPERFIDPTQHPRWTREKRTVGDGLKIFENAVAYFG